MKVTLIQIPFENSLWMLKNKTLLLHLSFLICSDDAGEGNGTLLQYSCLENPMDGGAWWAAVQGVAKSRAQLSDFTFTFTPPCWSHIDWKPYSSHNRQEYWGLSHRHPRSFAGQRFHSVRHEPRKLEAVVAPSTQ